MGIRNRQPARAVFAVAAGVAILFAVAPKPAAAIDASEYLVQRRCLDGSPPIDCSRPVPQHAGDKMLWRRGDWGNRTPPGSYQLSDSVVADDGRSWITTWSYPPFGRFVARDGDGGEVYVASGGGVRIDRTQDGGKPGIQYFVGTKCGGTGWILFGPDIAPGYWSERVAMLSDRPDPNDCPSRLAHAFTRYRIETLALPFEIGGRRRTITAPTLISEHCAGPSLERCAAMERFYFTEDWGRVFWSAWTPRAAPVDLSARCPALPFDTPPLPGWHLDDCRLTTRIIPADGTLSVDGYGWPGQR